jgi:hypothetical protein
MKSYVVKPDSSHRWQAKPGCRILVMGGGAVRFDFPQNWIASVDSKYVRLIDREPPDDNCGLMVSWRYIPAAMAAVRMHYLIREITLEPSDARPIVRRSPIFSVFRPPLEAAWRQMHFWDGGRRREGCTRVCLARGGCTWATIVFDFWPEDEIRLYPMWATILETLAVGDYIDDPLTGRKREKRG